MNYPLVSIKCMVYNHGPYLRQCLDGFVMQKTNFAFEVIVHDDASTDNSAEIIREYAEKYPDIIKPIYEKENQYSKHDGSIQKIMDDAIHPNVKYIAMCEGDDYWTDSNKLQIQVDFLENNTEFSLVCHRFLIYDQEEAKFYSDFDEKYFKDKSGIEFSHNMPIWLPKTLTLVYRKESLAGTESYKGFRKDTSNVYFMLKKGKGYCLNRIMGVYRRHLGGVFSKKKLFTNIAAGYKVWKDLYNYDKSKVARNNYYSSYASLLILSHGKILFEERFDIVKFFCVPYYLFLKLIRIIQNNIDD